MLNYQVFLIPFVSSIIACLIIIFTKNFHKKYTSDEELGVQKSHDGQVLRIGGLSIFFSLVINLLFSNYLFYFYITDFFYILTVAVLPIFLIGLIEDVKKNIGPFYRLLSMTFFVVISSIYSQTLVKETGIYFVDNFLNIYLISLFVTTLSIVALSNAINFIDGLHGLASWYSVIILISFLFLINLNTDQILFNVILSIIGGLLGFIIFNWPYGKIFLGDGGAYLLGSLLAFLSIKVVNEISDVNQIHILILFGYPVWELLFTISRRILSSKNIMKPDMKHFHSEVFFIIRILVKKYLIKVNNRNLQSSLSTFFILLIIILPIILFFNLFAYLDTTYSLIIFIFLEFFYFTIIYYGMLNYKKGLTDI